MVFILLIFGRHVFLSSCTPTPTAKVPRVYPYRADGYDLRGGSRHLWDYGFERARLQSSEIGQ
jgi:hypothetical protein